MLQTVATALGRALVHPPAPSVCAETVIASQDSPSGDGIPLAIGVIQVD